MATEKKVFDVGKPGSEKPQTGSKPMVIGHKGLLADPTLKKEEDKPETEMADTEPVKTEKSKVDLKPLTEEEKPTKTTADDSSDGKKETEDKTPKDPEPEAEKSPDSEKDTPTAEETKKEKQKDEDIQDAERQEKLQSIIKSKQYFVPIKESNKTAVKSFTTTLLVVFIVGIIVALVLIDAEIIDLGVELPFNLL